MPLMTGFAILVGEAIIGFYKKVHAINFGVYGATMVGKTTLSHQLRTRGEVPQINQRTVGRHRASRKNIKIDGNSHTIRSADIGGEASNDDSGHSVSLSSDGSTVAIGAPYNDGITGNIFNERGHVRVYQKRGNI